MADVLHTQVDIITYIASCLHPGDAPPITFDAAILKYGIPAKFPHGPWMPLSEFNMPMAFSGHPQTQVYVQATRMYVRCVGVQGTSFFCFLCVGG